MPVTAALKRLSLATGTYRPARWLSRRLRPSRRRAMQEDIGLYRRLLPRDALCFDVGANIGEKSEAMLRAGAGRVVAFEPNPEVLPELVARCSRWPNWTLVRAGLGAAPGLSMLYVRERHGQSGMLQDWGGRIMRTYHVPLLTLDAAVAHFGVPAYCKLDVEGWELEVLRGLGRPLPLVSFEFHLESRDIAKTRGCLELMRSHGEGRVNITPAESAYFHYPEWQPLERFAGWFPGDLERTLPVDIYGDIFVSRTNSAPPEARNASA